MSCWPFPFVPFPFFPLSFSLMVFPFFPLCGPFPPNVCRFPPPSPMAPGRKAPRASGRQPQTPPQIATATKGRHDKSGCSYLKRHCFLRAKSQKPTQKRRAKGTKRPRKEAKNTPTPLIFSGRTASSPSEMLAEFSRKTSRPQKCWQIFIENFRVC